MSAGSRVRGVRIDDDLWAEVELTIQRRNVFTQGEPWDISKFIKAAIREKLDKMERSRTSRGRARLNAILDEAADLESVRAENLSDTVEDDEAIS